MNHNTAILERGIEKIRAKAIDTADQGTDRVAGVVGHVSDTLRDTAKRVDQPKASRALKSSAKAFRSTEKQLRSEGAAGLANMMWASMKAHPGRYMIVAIAMGLVVGRSTRRRTDAVRTGSVTLVEVKEVR
jgi:hypothetical protein